mmetsp:Transcript_30816/g.98402  ORF Transcript_30816/g.98402 Transcript_30816/m.98402 type:complete len:396 (+) Transcript_30816:242-1429(+)
MTARARRALCRFDLRHLGVQHGELFEHAALLGLELGELRLLLRRRLGLGVLHALPHHLVAELRGVGRGRAARHGQRLLSKHLADLVGPLHLEGRELLLEFLPLLLEVPAQLVALHGAVGLDDGEALALALLPPPLLLRLLPEELLLHLPPPPRLLQPRLGPLAVNLGLHGGESQGPLGVDGIDLRLQAAGLLCLHRGVASHLLPLPLHLQLLPHAQQLLQAPVHILLESELVVHVSLHGRLARAAAAVRAALAVPLALLRTLLHRRAHRHLGVAELLLSLGLERVELPEGAVELLVLGGPLLGLVEARPRCLALSALAAAGQAVQALVLRAADLLLPVGVQLGKLEVHVRLHLLRVPILALLLPREDVLRALLAAQALLDLLPALLQQLPAFLEV